jgi:HTH-type transcriptional regulator/antitoxin HigA
MQEQNIIKIYETWPSIANIIFVPHTQEDYDYMLNLLDMLIDEVRDNENHQLASLLELVGEIIDKYETENFPELADLEK